jgi:D-3-phosphoglycerate dehydrogenase
MSYRILVLEGITERGLELLSAEGWQIEQAKAMSPSELAKVIAPYDAMMIRSGTRVTEEALQPAARLRIIGRPGVGVDNVDLDAATRRGIVVMNSPGGNIVSTAELTLALLFAVARPVAAADASMKAERWDRKSFGGVELHGKRLGVVGLGRIGREVAARCRALGMDVVTYDPFVSEAVAEQLGVKPVRLEELLAGSDYVTLHTVLSAETRHLIGKEALSKVKPGIRIVNAARGELIDEAALREALDSGRVAGAALDVHAQEPPRDWGLAKHPKVVATPHIGAQTREAQERVGTDIAVQVRDYLKGGVIQQAVNFFSLSGELYDTVKPAMDLGQRLGAFLAQVCRGRHERIELGLYGELRELDAKPILQATVAGALGTAADNGNVTVVNSVAVAKERGVAVVQSTSSAPIGFANLIAVRLKTADDDLSVAGTLFGHGHLRLVEIDAVEVDAIPAGRLLYVKNDDTPGVVGHIGTLLGEHKVNIARMTVGRKPGSGRAVMLIEIDGELEQRTLQAVRAIAGVREARAITL